STWVPGEGGGGGGGSYSETIGDGSNSSYQVTHGLGTEDLVVQLWDLTGAVPVEATADADSIEATDAGTVTVTFAAPPAIDSYRVVILSDGGTSSGGGGSSWGDLILPGNAPSGLDIAYEFDDADDLNDFTLVTVSGNATWDVAGDTLSALSEGQTSGDAAAALVAIPGTPAAPYEIRTAVR